MIVIFQTSRPYIIWWAVLMHIAWGLSLILDQSVGPLAILVGLRWLIELGVPPPTVGVVLTLAAMIAGGGLMLGRRLSRGVSLICLMPQYMILIASFISDSQSILSGYVDSVAVDRMLLFSVLSPIMIASILHTLAIIERHLSWHE